MNTGLNKVLDHLRWTLAPPEGGLTDGQLLARFVASRDEESFATLMRRHGPMVWRLCLRALGHIQNAEDAFQATFLVLACKAGTVLKRESVGSFLYGVAYRTALKAKAIHARRQSRERQVEDMPHPEMPPIEPHDWLDHELNLLPEKYRAVIVVCELEGRSRKETARQLGLSEGTVSSRLARGRRLLAKRLSRYGLSLSVGALAAAPTHVPASLLSSTTEMAMLVATGQVTAVSGSVEVLKKGALKMMFLAKLKLTVGVMVVVTALGAVGLAYRATAQEPRRAPPSASRAADDLESLRLEIEALRKELRATHERVKTLEGEMRAMKETGGRASNRGGRGAGYGSVTPDMPTPGADNFGGRGETPRPRSPYSTEPATPRPSDNYPPRSPTSGTTSERPDPLTEAEAALKQLRRDPTDKQAAEALERALKRLKEREKPRSPVEGNHGRVR
jgi:RNA polymerase sigma factor (sigma-70 family)